MRISVKENNKPQINAKLYESFIKNLWERFIKRRVWRAIPEHALPRRDSGGVCEAYPNTSQTEVSVYERRFIVIVYPENESIQSPQRTQRTQSIATIIFAT